MVKYELLTHKEVDKFVEHLDDVRQAKVIRISDLFKEYGIFLPSKYLKKVAKDIWELRPGDVRLFLTIRGNKGLVVHAIRKKTRKTPKRDLDLAIERVKKEVG
jgi:phage-related protein